MKHPVLASWLLALVSCSRDPTVVVTVDSIPPTAQSLQAIATHAGFAAARDLDPWDLPSPPPSALTLLLQLPSGFGGDLGVSVAAFDQPGGRGCLLASGVGQTATFSGLDETLRAPLFPVTDPGACADGRPLLLRASPPLGSTRGNEPVRLTGWGFRPDSSVMMGSAAAPLSFLSASEIEVTTPAHAGLGLTHIAVSNRDGSATMRRDLFRFFSDTVSFTEIRSNLQVNFNSTAHVAVGRFDPTTDVDLAISLPERAAVRTLFSKSSAILSMLEADYTVGAGPGPLVTADFDGDGDLDLVVANSVDGTIQFLLNDGTGKFTKGALQNVGPNPSAMTTADLNSDGRPDLALTNSFAGMAGFLRVFLNQGGGVLTEIAGSPFSTAIEPSSLVAGDYNNDNRPDIAVANAGDEPPGSGKYKVTIFLNVGDGLFQNSPTTRYNLLPSGCQQPTSIATMDSDGNGKQDLVLACALSNKVHIIRNQGFPNYSEYQLATDAGARNLTLADLNGDGIADIIAPARDANQLNIFLNKQGRGFEDVPRIRIDTQCGRPFAAVTFDIDSDGRTDIGVVGDGLTTSCFSLFFNQSL